MTSEPTPNMDHNETQPNPIAAAHAGEPQAGEYRRGFDDGIRVAGIECQSGLCPGKNGPEPVAAGGSVKTSARFDWAASRRLAEMAESALCNVLPLAHFTGFQKWLSDWRDERHRIYPDGPNAYVDPTSTGSIAEEGDATAQAEVACPQSNRQHAGEGKDWTATESVTIGSKSVASTKTEAEEALIEAALPWANPIEWDSMTHDQKRKLTLQLMNAGAAVEVERAPLVGRERESLD